MSILKDIKLQYSIGGILQKIIYWNVGLFLISIVFFYQFSEGRFSYPRWIALSSNFSDSLKFFWTLITYSFFHAGFIHLLFNMIVLNFSGQLFLTFFNQKQLLGVYILGSIFSGLVYLLCYTFLLDFPNSILVGASASIMAILFATVTYAPLMKVRLLLVGNVKLWHIALVILVLDILQIGLSNTGGNISHLAGALFGFIFVTLLKNGIDLTNNVSKIIEFVTNVFSKKKKKKYTPFKEVHVNKNIKPRTPSFEKNKNQQQVDEILDKISSSGYDSLTKEEKDFLFSQK